MKKEEKPKTVRDVLVKYFKTSKVGKQFHGYDLRDYVVRYIPEKEKVYVDTVLRIARMHFRDCFVLVNKGKSLYKVVKNVA